MTSFGTFANPFAANSPWNSRPVSPVFGTATIPDDPSGDFPVVASGSLATQAFLASASDPQMQVLGPVGAQGINCPDDGGFRSSRSIPHWPAGVVPAPGTDGHAEIVDPTTGIVHSFWQLVAPTSTDPNWRANEYCWTALGGRGWGDPAHWMQGARSSGVSTLGGLIRQPEINDGAPSYAHALAMSLAYSGMSAAPTHIFPATSADIDAAVSNTGPIALGTLMMLPPSFDTSTIGGAQLRKVAETLKAFGAYVVDRNQNTPFAIYAENGPVPFALTTMGWNPGIEQSLRDIQYALRPVVGAASRIDGNGNPFAAFETNLNMISMRGPWAVESGNSASKQPWFDSWNQCLQFNAAPGDPPLVVSNQSGTAFSTASGVKPIAGQPYHLVAHCTGGAKVRLCVMVWNQARQNFDIPFDSGYMADWTIIGTAAAPFVWPAGTFEVWTYAEAPPNGAAGSCYMTLVAMP